jgi:hypothetical protein
MKLAPSRASSFKKKTFVSISRLEFMALLTVPDELMKMWWDSVYAPFTTPLLSYMYPSTTCS